LAAELRLRDVSNRVDRQAGSSALASVFRQEHDDIRSTAQSDHRLMVDPIVIKVQVRDRHQGEAVMSEDWQSADPPDFRPLRESKERLSLKEARLVGGGSDEEPHLAKERP